MSRNLEQEVVFVSLVQSGVGRERSFHGWWGVNWRRNVEGLVDENEGWTTGIGEDEDGNARVHEDLRWNQQYIIWEYQDILLLKISLKKSMKFIYFIIYLLLKS